MPESPDELYALAYNELRRMARAIRRGRGDDTLNTTALVHETYLKLVEARSLAWQDRAHFLAIAARAMRQVLINELERKQAGKRGGGARTITLPEALGTRSIQEDEVLAVDDALEKLEARDPRQARVLECRFFGGLTVEETALALGVSEVTVKRDWRAARAWLMHVLG